MMEVITVENAQVEAVLTEIDSIVKWKKDVEAWIEQKLARLGFLLYEAKRGCYWSSRGLDSEDAWIDSIFPQSKSQYYAILGIGEKLCPLLAPQTIEQIGRCKAEDLVRVVRHLGELPPEWTIKAVKMGQVEFRHDVRAFIAGNVSREAPDKEVEFVTLKFAGDQIRVYHKAIKSMNKILGTDKSDTFALEMILGDFLAGSLEDGSAPSSGENWFLLNRIQRLIELINWSDLTVAKRLIGIVASELEKAKDGESNIGHV